MKISIRQATLADAGAISLIGREIQALHAAALPWYFRSDDAETFSPAEFSTLLEQPNNLILIAETDSGRTGYAYAEFLRHIESTLTHYNRQLYLRHIGITAAQRRKGIGTALIAALGAAGKERGVDMLAVDVWRFNEEARAFYRRPGFETYSETMWSR
jgi:ribosomal protein S18 acetylase RimI-like enzyme